MIIRQFKWIRHYFSFPLLVKTLFSPWKRMMMEDKTPGFDPQIWFQTFTFNLVSRLVGFVVRTVLFFVGVVLIVLGAMAGAFGFIFYSRFLESLGYYDPCTEPPRIKIDYDRADYWIGRGARPSNTVKKLLEKR